MLEPTPIEEAKTFKRDLMSEFSALYCNTTEPLNMSSIRQLSEEVIEVALQQYPEQGETHDITIFDELHRLRFFGWQIRVIKYDKDGTLFIHFDKVDWRSRKRYGLTPTVHNNEEDLWWLNR